MKHYEFPRIAHLDDVLPHIEGVEEIKLMERPDHLVIDYLFVQPETFPAIPDEPGPEYDRAVMRRECRGLLFAHTGELVGRRFHKFFNLGEREETQPHKVDYSRPHRILSKEDGSMLSAFMDPQERIHWVFDQNHAYAQRVYWGTRMGWTDVAQQAEQFIQQSNFDYDGFARHWLARGWNPIFEYCSPKSRIVLQYDSDRMILIGLRHLETGVYKSVDELREYANSWNIPVVSDHGTVDCPTNEFIERVRGQTDVEGYVTVWDSGHAVKLKTDWYLRFHKSKENLVFEKDVWALILNGEADDVKPVLMDHDLERLERFQENFYGAIYTLANDLATKVVEMKQNAGDDRRAYADQVKQNLSGPLQSMAFNLFSTEDVSSAAIEQVRNYALKHTGSASKVEEARKLIQVRSWDET